MTANRRSRHFALPALLALGLLTGCGKTELYTGLNERDANEMLALLLRAGIATDKVAAKDGVTLSVDSARVPEAVALLTAAGLPHREFARIGDLFKREGMISSPSEERVRFIYGVSQELERTISTIDGVLNARVHIVLPGNDPTNKITKPSSAAILIRYKSDASIDALVPKIKELVVNSVEGLAYDRVSVVLVKATADELADLQTLQQRAAARYATLPPYVTYSLAGLLLASLLGNGALGWLLWQRNGRRLAPASSPT
ncbi:MAG: type III secretion inner membrane ring lipoprotein SctJ [Acetobacteraceae bacterium]|nr:type III secretion inner membrane ring lipoprotein SctJ [Pseudomonadota bacterium]